MKTLRRNKEGIYNTAQNYHRKFSAIAKGARADRPRHQECLVLVETRDTYTPLLHQIFQSCARTGAPMEGKACHGQIIRVGLQAGTLTSNILINMYSKCGLVDCAGKMRREGNHFSEFTVSSVLCACAVKCAVF
ncbi:unnamed protein product [Prunus armeniaca]|uniref:Uncharacterized protein n=1 Tax=Prunus armeniaca TaxID=36596 RepID=A0A6J5WLT3_PRUAR|nr:unnamed protein product [Prunus armeniaca]